MFIKNLTIIATLSSIVACSAMSSPQELRVLTSRAINTESATSSTPAANISTPADSDSKSDQVSGDKAVTLTPPAGPKNSTQLEAPKKDSEHTGTPQVREGDEKAAVLATGPKNSTQNDAPKKDADHVDDSGTKPSGPPGSPKAEAGHGNDKSSGTSVKAAHYSWSLLEMCLVAGFATWLV